MPFGDHTVTRKVVLDEDGGFITKTGGIRNRAVVVPEAEPPVWWSEYLLEEWKRKNKVGQRAKDPRTSLQKAEDEWLRGERLYALTGKVTSTGAPRHELW